MAFSDLFSHIFNTKHFRVASGLVWRTKNKCEYINDLEVNALSPGMIREWPQSLCVLKSFQKQQTIKEQM